VRVSDFDYALPPERIAQAPLPRRDDARLYFLPRSAREGTPHRAIRELPDLLPEGALLVVNDTRVIPARLKATKPTGGRAELLLVEPLASDDGLSHWRCLGGASKPIRPGPLHLKGEGAPACAVVATDGEYVDVVLDLAPEALPRVLERIGEVPLPPYIRREEPSGTDDRQRYQTIFAERPGAVAAPTAGLHFTPKLLQALSARGCERATVTLHVGPGTFAPLRSDELDGVELHPERYQIPTETADAIARARAERRPVVAVGTTVVRTLETAANDDGTVRAGEGSTRLFIKPGHRFRAVDALVTNFHLPRSTLLMLVAAFVGATDGRARVLAAYEDAVREGYRFYSYGDAMLIS
jgi:S-adenosylmethionine:tRNA ribosyltransferase-isomerase